MLPNLRDVTNIMEKKKFIKGGKKPKPEPEPKKNRSGKEIRKAMYKDTKEV